MLFTTSSPRRDDLRGHAITSEYLTVHPHSFDVRLRDGRWVRIRPIVAEDREGIARGLQRMSPKTRYRRFHRAIDTLSERELGYLANVDQERHVAWGAVSLEEPGRPGVAAARFVRDALDPDEAEFAIAIVDDYQSVGLGRLLMETLLLSAADAGLQRLVGFVLPENTGAINLFRSLGARMAEGDDGELRAEIPIETESRSLRMSGEVRLARTSADARQ